MRSFLYILIHKEFVFVICRLKKLHETIYLQTKATKLKDNWKKTSGPLGTNAMIEVNAEGKLLKIKEERGLLQWLVVISRSRPQLDLK